uniref:Uncharacterized protein n=1 Tax=Anguilla anguilla TaxID=7936 RepID=A0A0E9PYR8_ANGAN
MCIRLPFLDFERAQIRGPNAAHITNLSKTPEVLWAAFGLNIVFFYF